MTLCMTSGVSIHCIDQTGSSSNPDRSTSRLVSHSMPYQMRREERLCGPQIQSKRHPLLLFRSLRVRFPSNIFRHEHFYSGLYQVFWDCKSVYSHNW